MRAWVFTEPASGLSWSVQVMRAGEDERAFQADYDSVMQVPVGSACRGTVVKSIVMMPNGLVGSWMLNSRGIEPQILRTDMTEQATERFGRLLAARMGADFVRVERWEDASAADTWKPMREAKAGETEAMKNPTIEEIAKAYYRQFPDCVLSDHERAFLASIHHARSQGVGFGWMRTVVGLAYKVADPDGYIDDERLIALHTAPDR